MDAPLLASCALVGILAAGMGWRFAKKSLPARVTPFARLSEAMQERIARRKRYWRGAALAVFALAAATLFSGLPRGVSILCICMGFFCQYKVFSLRRRYPMSFLPGALSEEGRLGDTTGRAPRLNKGTDLQTCRCIRRTSTSGEVR